MATDIANYLGFVMGLFFPGLPDVNFVTDESLLQGKDDAKNCNLDNLLQCSHQRPVIAAQVVCAKQSHNQSRACALILSKIQITCPKNIANYSKKSNVIYLLLPNINGVK